MGRRGPCGGHDDASIPKGGGEEMGEEMGETGCVGEGELSGSVDETGEREEEEEESEGEKGRISTLEGRTQAVQGSQNLDLHWQTRDGTHPQCQ
jgi:hypothetical protein